VQHSAALLLAKVEQDELGLPSLFDMPEGRKTIVYFATAVPHFSSASGNFDCCNFAAHIGNVTSIWLQCE
jgi:hypothetical protein